MNRPSLRHARLLAVALVPAFAVLGVAGTPSAHADDKCPPGSWFCADGEIKIGPGEAPATPPPPAAVPAPAAQPPVVIYMPAPPPAPVYQPPPPTYTPPPPERSHSETGLAFRVEGVAFGANDRTTNRDSGAMGVGASLRFRPIPRIAIDIGIDAIGGTDANGYKRHETPVSILGLLYLNPRSKTQVYLLAGFGYSQARVEVEDGVHPRHDDTYSYFGGLFGGGLEFRVARKVALNFDVRGFVRGRTDDAAASQPEFTSRDGRKTNTSGGAMITGGMTFYF